MPVGAWGSASPGTFAWRGRPASLRALRRIFLATEITQVHRDSGGVYGAHRVTAELRFGRQIVVGHNAVAAIMRQLGIKGVPRRRVPRGARVGNVACEDLVKRRFARNAPDELWMTDITEHPTREGKIFCCAVIDAFDHAAVDAAIDDVPIEPEPGRAGLVAATHLRPAHRHLRRPVSASGVRPRHPGGAGGPPASTCRAASAR